MRSVACAITSFPVRWAMTLSGLGGDLMNAVDRRHRKRARENIHASFPDKPAAWLDETVRRSMRAFPDLFMEVLFTPRVMRLETIRDRADLKDIGRTLRLLLDDGRGLIFVTGHYGNWEGLGYALALMGFDTTSVARPLDNPYLNEFVMGVRESKGQRILDKKGAIEVVPGELERHGVVAFIADQDAGKKGIFVPFFGREASTYKSIGLLAMEHEVPIAVGYARRRIGDYRLEVGVQDVIEPDDWRGRDDPLRYVTERYTRAIEDFVADDPRQYLWIHRRWKTRPRHEIKAAKLAAERAAARVAAADDAGTKVA